MNRMLEVELKTVVVREERNEHGGIVKPEVTSPLYLSRESLSSAVVMMHADNISSQWSVEDTLIIIRAFKDIKLEFHNIPNPFCFQSFFLTIDSYEDLIGFLSLAKVRFSIDQEYTQLHQALEAESISTAKTEAVPTKAERVKKIGLRIVH